MNKILVSDIFGKTPALEALGDELNANTIVDPYAGEFMEFRNESDAYSFFVKNAGLDDYTSKLLEAIELTDCTSLLIGFSIGASAIWRISDKIPNGLVDRAICFYGAQIRNFADVIPKIEVELIFPCSEPHFDVLELQTRLSKTPNVKTSTAEYLHGFMNCYSKNYSQQAYQEQVDFLKRVV